MAAAKKSLRARAAERGYALMGDDNSRSNPPASAPANSDAAPAAPVAAPPGKPDSKAQAPLEKTPASGQPEDKPPTTNQPDDPWVKARVSAARRMKR